MIDRRLSPMLAPAEAPAPARARGLTLERCSPQVAREFVAAWHSRLPATQVGPWRFGFVAHHQHTCFGAALWHNPSARGLPNEWLELRRLAIPDDAPPHTASWMLGAMAKWVRANLPEVPRLISYQDTDVHTGTIYKAAGWTAAYYAKPRQRDRTSNRVVAAEPVLADSLFGDVTVCDRVSTGRKYRSDLNGQAPAGAGKIRWELEL